MSVWAAASRFLRRVFPPRVFFTALEDGSVLMSDCCHLFHSFVVLLSSFVENDRMLLLMLLLLKVEVVVVKVLVLDMDRSERFVKRLVIVASDAIVYLELNLVIGD